ncbi:MAG: hypothetical protein GXX79_05290 [Actinomycetales bacterium]|nr:hypothetical protein [Actinomycetales bacterium]
MTDPGDRLRQAGLRVTAARLAVLDIVERSPHLPAPDIARLARERLGSLSTQAVYETLRAMTAANLLRSIAPTGSPSRYEARDGDPPTSDQARADRLERVDRLS